MAWVAELYARFPLQSDNLFQEYKLYCSVITGTAICGKSFILLCTGKISWSPSNLKYSTALWFISKYSSESLVLMNSLPSIMIVWTMPSGIHKQFWSVHFKGEMWQHPTCSYWQGNLPSKARLSAWLEVLGNYIYAFRKNNKTSGTVQNWVVFIVDINLWSVNLLSCL